MAYLKTDYDWTGIASTISIIANTNRDPGKNPDPFTLYDFHPLRTKPETALPRVSVKELANILGVKKGKRHGRKRK